MSVIIIEGCDLSGKSYAIERIAKKLNSGFVLKNAFKPKTLEDSPKLYAHYWEIVSMILDRPYPVILDRFFPSQLVYSYLRGDDEMIPYLSEDITNELYRLEVYGSKRGFKYIYLDTDLELLKFRYQERGDEHISIEDLTFLKLRYDVFFAATKMEKFAIDTTKDGWLDEAIEFIRR